MTGHNNRQRAASRLEASLVESVIDFRFRATRLGHMRMWLFLLVVVFIIGILIFGVPKP